MIENFISREIGKCDIKLNFILNDKNIKTIISTCNEGIIYDRNNNITVFHKSRNKIYTYMSKRNIRLDKNIKFIDNNIVSINGKKIQQEEFNPIYLNYYSNDVKQNILTLLIICKNIKQKKIIVPKYMKFLICNHFLI